MVRANDLQYFDLRQFLFQDCVLTLPQGAGKVSGLDLRTKPGRSFTASFKAARSPLQAAFSPANSSLRKRTRTMPRAGSRPASTTGGTHPDLLQRTCMSPFPALTAALARLKLRERRTQ